MRKRYFLLLYILAAILILATGCHKETEEDKVRKVIDRIQHAVEEKKIAAVLEHIAKSYRDPQGNDLDGIKGLLLFYFYRHQKVSVSIPSIDVTVTGPSARATFQTVLAGRGGGEEAQLAIMPEALGVYDFEVSFKKEEKEWKVVSAAWKRAGEGSGQ